MVVGGVDVVVVGGVDVVVVGGVDVVVVGGVDVVVVGGLDVVVVGGVDVVVVGGVDVVVKHTGFDILFESSVTAPFLANKRPLIVALVLAVIEVRAKTVP